MRRNRWTASVGTGGRHGSESVVGMRRNRWSTCVGISNVSSREWASCPEESGIHRALVLGGFVLGIAATRALDGRNPDSPAAEVPDVVFPTAVLKAWFQPVSEYDTGGQPLDDESFGTLMTALAEALTAEETLADFGQEGDIHLWNFVRRRVRPELTERRGKGSPPMWRGSRNGTRIQRHDRAPRGYRRAAVRRRHAHHSAIHGDPRHEPSHESKHLCRFGLHRRGVYRRPCRRAAQMDQYRSDHAGNRERLQLGGDRYFGELGRILQRVQLTRRQEERVFAALEEIKAANEEFVAPHHPPRRRRPVSFSGYDSSSLSGSGTFRSPGRQPHGKPTGGRPFSMF